VKEMTEKQYYKNVNLQSLETTVISTGITEENEHYVILKETIFYPTGGGQPHDTGWINGIEVYNVEEIDGQIRHFVKEPIKESKASCQLDFKRRFDHMQQHAGQHILSATFENYFHLKTVSFHLGTNYCTIDLDTEEVAEDLLAKVESLANQIIIENRPILTKWVTKEQAAQLPLRKALSVEEDIRLVIIPDYDYNGCGGTHPEFTGQVMTIKIMATEKMKQKTRVTFICGNRVIHELHKKTSIITTLQEQLNSPEEKLVDAAKRVLQSEKEKQKEIDALKETILDSQVQNILDSGQEIHVIELPNETMANLQKFAKKCIAAKESLILCLVSTKEDSIQFVCAKGKLATSELSMKQLNTWLIEATNGKGGGNDLFAQGGGKFISVEEIVQVAKQYLQV